MTNFNAPTPGQLPQKPKKDPTSFVVIGVVIALLLILVAATRFTISNHSTPRVEPSPTATTQSPEPTTVETTPTYDPSDPEQYEPQKSDFRVSLKKKGKECFGPAGCLVSYEVRVKGNSAYPSEGYVTIYYKIKGDEDGPIEGSIELDMSDEGSYYVPRHTLSIPGQSEARVKLVVTDIEYEQ